MEKKQKLFLTLLLLSLTVLLIGFQNCSAPSGGGLSDSDLLSGIGGSGGVIPENPIVMAATNSLCSTPTNQFSTSATIYICVQNVGSGLDYSLFLNGNYLDYTSIPSARWTKGSNGWYYTVYSYPTGDPLTSTGTYTVEVQNISDTSFTGSLTFTVQ